MHILLDGRILNENTSGTQRYILELVKHLLEDETGNIDKIYVCSANKKNVKKHFGNINIITKINKKNKVDIYHKTYPVQNYIELSELLSVKRSVITVHDLILINNPSYFVNKKAYDDYFKLFEYSLHLADKVIAISEHNKKDIINSFNINPEKIEVIYHGIDNEKFKLTKDKDIISKFKEKYQLFGKYILFIGTDYPHKNTKRLLKAFYKFVSNAKFNDYELVIIGNKQFINGNIHFKDELDMLGNKVRSMGFIPDSDIALFYNCADIFVFPSLYEGFGFPVLESFACGTPVICSNITSLPEVAGDAAIFVDPYNTEDITEKMITLATNEKLKTDLIAKGLMRVKSFTWDKRILGNIDVYKAILTHSSKPKGNDYYIKKMKRQISRKVNNPFYHILVNLKYNVSIQHLLKIIPNNFKKNIKRILFYFK